MVFLASITKRAGCSVCMWEVDFPHPVALGNAIDFFFLFPFFFFNGFMIWVYVIMCHFAWGKVGFTLVLHISCESLSGSWGGDACIGPLCLKQVDSNTFMALLLCVILHLAFQDFSAFSMPRWAGFLWPFVWNSSFFLEPAKICRSRFGNRLASSLLKQGLASQKNVYLFAAGALIHMFRPGPCWQIVSNSTSFRNN